MGTRLLLGTRLFLALVLVLLLLGREIQGDPLPDQDEPTDLDLLEKFQQSLYGYWDTVKAATWKLYEKTYLSAVDEKIRDMYSKSTAAMTTYTGIFTDQVITMLQGDQ
ncbi:apolipoprotein C-II [Ctenodactylus gundi]